MIDASGVIRALQPHRLLQANDVQLLRGRCFFLKLQGDGSALDGVRLGRTHEALPYISSETTLKPPPRSQ